MRSSLCCISAIIFCMVSPAFGTLSLTANGEDVEYLSITYDTDIMMGIYSDEIYPPSSELYQVYLSITGDSSLGLWTGDYSLFTVVFPPIEPCERVDEYTWLVSWHGSDNMIAEFEYMGLTLAWYDVHVTLYDSDMNQLDRIFIEQIPEPATLVLLGLGGLLIRRK